MSPTYHTDLGGMARKVMISLLNMAMIPLPRDWDAYTKRFIPLLKSQDSSKDG